MSGKQYLVAVDSGHGMETSGKRTPPLPQDVIIGGMTVRKKGETIREKEFNRAVADRLISALARCGIGTVDVSPGLKDVPLADRYKAANSAKANLFISKHYNAKGGDAWWTGGYLVGLVASVAGTTTRAYAKCVMDELAKVVPWMTNGVQNDAEYVSSLAVLRHTTMPALLTETGFMDVWEQARRMLDPDFVRQDAEATCRGICKHLGVKYVEASATVPTTPSVPEPAPGPNEPSSWASASWDWATKEGITDGTNPKGNATREQVATMLYRLRQ